MAQEIDRESSDRQATWVALKTLRQRPSVVGRTDDGATVYAVRSVRLLLTPGSSHFKRLVHCARCGRDVPGSSVLSPADLDRPANPVFCDRCAQSSGPPGRREKEDPGGQEPAVAAGHPAAVDAPPATVSTRGPAPVEHAGDRQRLSEQVADVLRRQNAELAKVSASVAEVRAEMRELADVRAGLAAMIDASLQPLRAALADGLDDLRSEVASLRRRVDDLAPRSEMELIAEANHQLANVQRDLDQRVRDLAARPQPDSEAVGAGELAEVRASLAATIDTERTQLRAALAEGLDRLRLEIAGFEPRLRDESAALTTLLEAQRADLTRALHHSSQETLREVAEPLRDLTKAREDDERQLGDLQQRAEEGQRRMDALNAAVEAGASRHRALEQLINSTAQQLARLIEPPARPAPSGRPVPGGIMESLERQLRAAELRLLEAKSNAGEDSFTIT